MTDQEFAPLCEALFQIAEPVILLLDPDKATGRPRVPSRDAFLTICDKVYTGLPWRSLPVAEGRVRGSTAHTAFQNWTSLGVFQVLHAVVLRELNTSADYVLQGALPEMKKTLFLPHLKLERLNIVQAVLDRDKEGRLNRILVIATREATRTALKVVLAQAQERAHDLFAQKQLKVASFRMCLQPEALGAMDELLNLVLEQSR